MIFVHGVPETGLVWRAQIKHFAARGWRCVAPDMRGFGRSTVPNSIAAYCIREAVADMVELHDSRQADPMRENCTHLKEATLDGCHLLMLEKPAEVNRAIAEWL